MFGIDVVNGNLKSKNLVKRSKRPKFVLNERVSVNTFGGISKRYILCN
ncbi:hypothetical protein SBF1_2130005 [Candidatus Desulfosporosinus infrequens]|uniref:Uncharacterized protein n=1 Tax=Candidatus Desulfosporosinus infrequens TaxID=2043169 RepID=A0A2U3KKJ3_9FIRM|nr:hypothetical protein SBF1_2130005 [Candidatus Desulfosporosinus infrequens]